MLVTLTNGAVFSTDTYPATDCNPAMVASNQCAVPCQEDQPCFNCATDGNQICGTAATTVAVTPPAPGLPVTGGDIGGLALISVGAAFIGAVIVRATKRQKTNK